MSASSRAPAPASPSAPASPARATHHPGIALATVLGCQLMIGLDASVVIIALPRLRDDLGLSSTGLAWVTNAYTLAFGGLLLAGGRAGDLFGRRRVLLTGVTVFTLASLLGGLATAPWWLLSARVAQGVGAALAGPGVLALIATTFEEGPRRNHALGLFSAVAGTGLVVGLVLGGVLTTLSWRWVFFVNVPVGAAIVLLAPRFLPETERHRTRVDILGALTSTAGMTALVYGFLHAASAGWRDTQTLTALAVAVALLGTFGAVELHAPAPMMPLRLFTARNRAAGYLLMLLVPAAMFGVFFLLTQYVQDVLGLGPIRAGLAFVPLAVCQFAGARTAPRLLRRVAPKPLILIGCVLITAGLAWLTRLSATSGYGTYLFGPMVLVGLGVGCTFMPLNMTILTGVDGADSGAASGVLQTMQQVGGSVGLAVLVGVFGTAERHAAATSPGATPEVLLTHGVTGAFTAAVIFVAVALAVAGAVIRR